MILRYGLFIKFSYRLKILNFSNSHNSSITLVQTSFIIIKGRGGELPWSDGVDLTEIKDKSFLKE
jgi:hypothetical protein